MSKFRRCRCNRPSVWCAMSLAIFVALSVLCPSQEAIAGPAGYALWFGSADDDDEVVIPHNQSISFLVPPDAMTLELWFRSDGSRSRYHLMGKRSGCSLLNYNLGMEAEHLLGFASDLNPGYQLTYVPFTPSDTVWNHFALTADGFEIRAYINGALAVVDTGIVPTEVPDPLKIGQSGTCSDNLRLRGWIDEVRLWNVARTAWEIYDTYNRPIDPATPGLVGYWTFDEDLTDQNVYDLSPMGNHGTLGANAEVGSDDPTRVPSTAPLTCPCPPCPYTASDVNCDGVTNVVDVVLAVNSAFRSAPEPVPCCSYR